MNWREGLYKSIALLVVIAVAARVIVDLLAPALPALVALGALAVAATVIFRGPRTKR